MKKTMRMKSFTDVLNEHLDIVEQATGTRPTLKQIAQYVGIPESTFSKKHNNQNTMILDKDTISDKQVFTYDVADFTCNQMMKIVDFFNSHGDSSCTLLTLLYGENVKGREYDVPISALSLEWLSSIGNKNPEYVKMLNLLLSDNHFFGERLLSSFLFFCYRSMYTVNTIELGKTALSYDASTEVLKMLVLRYISSLLDDVSEMWSKKYEHDMDAIRKKATALREKNASSESVKENGQRSPTKEEIDRLQYKQKAIKRSQKGYPSIAEVINTVQHLSSISKEWSEYVREEHANFPVLELFDPLDN